MDKNKIVGSRGQTSSDRELEGVTKRGRIDVRLMVIMAYTAKKDIEAPA
jgi:hypothetical protein